jgi:type I restriction-modification system DNA methylase subunit
MDFQPFINYCKKLIKGDEKGEAQIFLDHFFIALGYTDGLKGAGASCEYRVRDSKKRTTSFADLVWKPIVLIEMKKSGEDLSIHYQQAFSYWSQLVPNRPQYVILCNFDEFWIYDFNKDIYEPQVKINLEELQNQKEAFTFLLPVPKKPLFQTDREDITEKVAYYVAMLYKSLIDRNRNPKIIMEDAMRYCLQCILCMYAEDIDLLPDKIFTRLIEECVEKEGTGHIKIPETYDLIAGLFREMNNKGITPTGRYKDVDYFNGGLFDKIIPIELTKKEVEHLDVACTKNWNHINPAIFGTIFEQGMEKDERHVLGAHYTHEIDIKKIVDPVIVQPWKKKIDEVMDHFMVKTKDETIENLKALHKELTEYKVLDPACGSGNFLFIAYKEVKLLEKEILKYLKTINTNKDYWYYSINCAYVSTKQFYGIDLNPFAVELAKVTLMIAKEMSIKEAMDKQDTLPLDNLDNNIICDDALFATWPEVDAIIGNPPYQSKNKMQQEFGAAYVNKLRTAYPEIPGRADFCVYWFYKAHKHLKQDAYAGLVGTNTIRQNYSREGSLDYIVNNGGEIFNAVSSITWSGEAVVFVSIVCWKKGNYDGEKILFLLDDKHDLHKYSLPIVNSSLSLDTDVVKAKVIECNKNPKRVFQGQTHGQEGFLLSKTDGIKLVKKIPKYKEVLKPFLIGEELVGNTNAQPERFVIDFTFKNLLEASEYKEPFAILQKKVLPFIEEKAKEEEDGISKPNGRKEWLNNWWQMWRRREDLLNEIRNKKRYIAGSRVSTRIFYEFISSEINPNDALICFAFDDDYSFGILQSLFHIDWLKAKCSTLKGDYRYTGETVFNTFPWPQNPTGAQINKVAIASKALRDARNKAMKDHVMSLRDLYRLLEQPGKNPIKDLHTKLDKAVMEAYGFNEDEDLLAQLLALNLKVAQNEKEGKPVQPPGLPDFVKNKEEYVSDDCVRFEWE